MIALCHASYLLSRFWMFSSGRLLLLEIEQELSNHCSHFLRVGSYD